MVKKSKGSVSGDLGAKRQAEAKRVGGKKLGGTSVTPASKFKKRSK